MPLALDRLVAFLRLDKDGWKNIPTSLYYVERFLYNEIYT